MTIKVWEKSGRTVLSLPTDMPIELQHWNEAVRLFRLLEKQSYPYVTQSRLYSYFRFVYLLESLGMKSPYEVGSGH